MKHISYTAFSFANNERLFSSIDYAFLYDLNIKTESVFTMSVEVSFVVFYYRITFGLG